MNYSEQKLESIARKERKAKRAVKAKDNAELRAILSKTECGKAMAAAVGYPLGKKGGGKKPPSMSKLKKRLWEKMSRVVRSWSSTCLACGQPTECAGHVVPANSGGGTAYFLANLIPMCFSCNGAELRHRGEWVYRFKQILGDDVVDALYLFNRESKENGWQFKKWWVLEQTDRMSKLLGEDNK